MFETILEVKVVGTGCPLLMVPCVENEASPSTNSALRTPPARARADIAYSFSPKTTVAVISPTGMRANEIV